MMTVNEVSKLTGVSIRTLQYYDKIDLLKPARYTDSGYRLYDAAGLDRLSQIMLFKELDFSLSDIRDILSNPDFDREEALRQHLTLLTMKKERLNKIISHCENLLNTGGNEMDFSAFDTTKMDEYAQRARQKWGSTAEYNEYEAKHGNRSQQDNSQVISNFMNIFAKFGEIRDSAPDSKEAQELVAELQNYISNNFYTCSNEVLAGLGQMYTADGEFAANIDRAGGDGTANFVSKAIAIYCKK